MDNWIVQIVCVLVMQIMDANAVHNCVLYPEPEMGNITNFSDLQDQIIQKMWSWRSISTQREVSGDDDGGKLMLNAVSVLTINGQCQC